MSTQMSFNTSCISTDGAAAEFNTPLIPMDIPPDVDILDGLC